jgi:hypothetical protein
VALVESGHSLKMYQHTQFHGPALIDARFHPRQKSECPPFGMVVATGLKIMASPSMA